MNYYKEIKKTLVDVEIYKRVKDYSKNKRAKYGDELIKEYLNKLINDVGRKYNERTLRRIRQFYLFCKQQKWSTVSTKTTWSHYCEVLSLSDYNKIEYYLMVSDKMNLSVRELRERIRSNEYERLDDKSRLKLITNEEFDIGDSIKHPIMIKNKYDMEEISEKMLKQMILEDIFSFMKELGNGFSLVDSEYKIKMENRFNYIDLLLFNIKYNCYVIIELKVIELKKEHIGQIKLYMNYVDKNVKKLYHDKTIGIIIAGRNNKLVMEYCSDSQIFRTTYQLV